MDRLQSWCSTGGPCSVVFKWSGVYAGFFQDNHLFDRNGRYLGWRDGRGEVWKYDGSWLGRVVDEHYLIRDLRALPQRRTPQVPPVPAQPPQAPPPRVARVPWPQCRDPLEDLLRLPATAELVGVWEAVAERLCLNADGSFQWSATEPAGSAIGTWELRGSELRLYWEGVEEPERCYAVIEFSGAAMLLRWLRKTGRSLPFWLYRRPDHNGPVDHVDESPAT